MLEYSVSFIEKTRDRITVKYSLEVFAKPLEVAQGRPVFPTKKLAGCPEMQV